MASTSEVLNLAADLIEERGWTYGGGGRPDKGGPLCLEGGIAAAVGADHHTDIWFNCPAYQAVSDYLGDRPYRWNDTLPFDILRAESPVGMDAYRAFRPIADERAAAQVVGVLRACAVIEAAKENPGPRVEALVFDAERVIEVDW